MGLSDGGMICLQGGIMTFPWNLLDFFSANYRFKDKKSMFLLFELWIFEHWRNKRKAQKIFILECFIFGLNFSPQFLHHCFVNFFETIFAIKMKAYVSRCKIIYLIGPEDKLVKLYRTDILGKFPNYLCLFPPLESDGWGSTVKSSLACKSEMAYSEICCSWTRCDG